MENFKDIKGLSSKEIEDRITQGKVNKTINTVGKSYLKIFTDNLLSFFNIVLFVIAGLMIYGGYYSGLLFLAVLIPNIIIGLYEDIKARRLMDKLHVLNSPKATVIRDGETKTINGEEIVIDENVILSTENQICADGIVLEGTIGVNESLLTGEPDIIYKKAGDIVYSGSYVVNGKALIRVNKVGNDSYVASLQSQAKKFKRSKSEILSSLKNLFKVIGGAVICMAIAMITIYAIQNKFSNVASFKKVIGPMSGSLVAMIPSGLYLLTSVALATAVISLAGKKAHVQDFYSVEMLARTDVLCVDKTGTITDGTMVVSQIIELSSINNEKIRKLLFKILNATGDNNSTAKALEAVAINSELDKNVKVLPFSSENKYSGATLNDGTYLMGAPEFINLNNKEDILSKAQEFTSKGYRVLVLAYSKEEISGRKFDSICYPIALLVLQDHIKDDAKKTFEWFNANDVAIRVISGDNAVTVSEIAKQAGILNADKYISLDGLSDEEVIEAANKYVVFGRVTPHQKSLLVESLQKAGHTVAMTGDGVNDILALKKADCSIAMASGAEASRNVSHIVLMNSNFASLPNVVAEGRRVVNNLQRTCSLFLVKTIFAVVISLTFLLTSVIANDSSVEYPFVTNHLYIWETVCLGLPAFFLALEPNSERIKGKFLTNLSKKSIPAGIMMLLGIFTIFGLYLVSKNWNIYTGVNSLHVAVNMCVLFMSVFSVVVLYRIAAPFDKYRLIVFISFATIAFGCLGVSYLLFRSGRGNLFSIDFSVLSGVNYLYTAFILLGASVIYLLYHYIINVIKPNTEKKDED